MWKIKDLYYGANISYRKINVFQDDFSPTKKNIGLIEYKNGAIIFKLFIFK